MSESIRKHSPILLKKVKSYIDLDEVLVDAKIVKTSDIGLLQWAIMAPLAKLDPTPSLAEIAQELGIERVEFLTKVAQELETIGIVTRVTGGSYKLTELGIELYNKGKIYSDKRSLDFSILYEPITKEWLKGLTLPRKITADNNETDNTVTVVEEDIRVPVSVVTEHARKTKNMRKDEVIFDHTIGGKIIRSSPVEVNILLIEDGIEIRSISDSFSDHNNTISKTLKQRMIEKEEINEYLSDLFDFEEKYESKGTIAVEELRDVKAFSPVEIEKAVESIANRPLWAAVQVDTCLEQIGKHRPKVVIATYEMKTPKNNTLIIPEILYIHISDFFPNYIIATDKQTITLKVVRCDGIRIPLLIMERSSPALTEEILENIKIDLERERSFSLYLAKYYIEPSREAFDEICIYLLSRIQSRDTTALSNKLLIDFLGLKEYIGEAELSKPERMLYKAWLSTYKLEDLISLDKKTTTKLLDVYNECLERALETELHQPSTKEIVSKHNELINKTRKLEDKERSNLIESLLKRLLSMQVGNIEKTSIANNDEEINMLFALTNIVDEPLVKAKITGFIYNKINAIDYPLEKNEQWYIKLKELGYKFTLEDLDKLLRRSTLGFKFDWLSEDTGRKIERINTLSKRLLSEYPIARVLQIPDLDGSAIIEDKGVIKVLLENISICSSSFKGIDDKWISERLNRIEMSLRRTDSPKSVELWLTFIDKVRAFSKKDKTSYLEVTDRDIISVLARADTEIIDKNKHLLKSMGLSDSVKMQMEKIKKADTPPVDRIVIDGSNVAGYSERQGEESVLQLIRAYIDLKDIGFKDIHIIVGARLRHYLGTEYFSKLKEFYERESEKIKYTVLQEAPAGTSDDHFVIRYAANLDALILTNDLYRDYAEKHPEFRDEIRRRLVKYMFDPKNSSLIISEYPEYLKENVK